MLEEQPETLKKLLAKLNSQPRHCLICKAPNAAHASVAVIENPELVAKFGCGPEHGLLRGFKLCDRCLQRAWKNDEELKTLLLDVTAATMQPPVDPLAPKSNN